MSKILHINCACTGSTGSVIGNISDYAVKSGIETLLCAPCAPGNKEHIRYFRTSLPYEQGIYRRLNMLYGFQYGFAPLSTIKIKQIINKQKPDLIHIHCLNGYMVNIYSLFRLIKKKRIPTVITNHAEFFYTGSCPHAYDCQRWLTGCGQCPQKTEATGALLWDTSAMSWRRMYKAFSGLENAVMVSVSPWVGSRAKQSLITKELPNRIVLNGVNTDVFSWSEPAKLKEKYGFSQNTKIVFHPTANFSASNRDSKGGRYIFALAEAFADQDVVFLVAGKHSQDLKVPKNLILLGKVADPKIMAEYYAMADVTVVTGKRETFNMPVAESLCCGTPVVGFFAGGPESIAMKEYSRFVQYGDITELEAQIRDSISISYDKSEISRQAKEKYSAAVMAKGYMDIYEELLSSKRVADTE